MYAGHDGSATIEAAYEKWLASSSGAADHKKAKTKAKKKNSKAKKQAGTVC